MVRDRRRSGAARQTAVPGLLSTRTALKVCCISSPDEARRAIEGGADALGLVSAMPSGPGVIPEELIAEVAASVPDRIDTFLLTSRVSAKAIAAQWERCRTRTLQLVDAVEPGELERLRRLLPGVRIFQVIHVAGEDSLLEARTVWESVDGLLLDSGNPGLAVKELGGTGRIHDWSISASICRDAPVPVYLAGGLNPTNVARAIRAVRPFGVDVCSGLRRQGGLDASLLLAFRRAVATA